MKILCVVIIFVVFALPVNADLLSSCHNKCYEGKQACNTRKAYTFNSCDKHHFACKASCNSGKPQGAYGVHSMEISFHPVLDLDN